MIRAVLALAIVAGCRSPQRWTPAPGTSWQLQLSGTIDPSVPVALYVVDLVDSPDDVLATLRARGVKIVCYFSAGTAESYRTDVATLPAGVASKILPEWPDERWLDIRAEPVRALVRSRLDHAVKRRCDGVDPDNVDAYTHDTGFPLTAADQLAFNRFVAGEAHERGLAVGLKNDLDQAADLVEECAQYGECDKAAPFVARGKPVFHVEYATEACPPKRAGFSTLLKRLDLDAYRVPCP